MVKRRINQGANNYTPCESNEVKATKPPRKEYFRLYYSKNKPKYLPSKQEYRQDLNANKPPNPLSFFQLLQLHQLLKLLVNHCSFVPVAPKLKHPTIKN